MRLFLLGAAAGAVTGLMGSGGGLILIPGFRNMLPEQSLFPGSLLVMIPIVLVSLLPELDAVPWPLALPCMAGSALGGIVSRKWKIPGVWLHRILGIFLLMGGMRYLW